MTHSRRLVTTRQIVIEDRTGKPISAYHVTLNGGGTLAVSVPGRPTASQAFEIADQLRELADVIVVRATHAENLLGVRDELLRTSELLRAQHAKVTDIESAHDLLEYYSHYRDAVVEYLRSAESG
jgi:hypothetical protein